MEETERDAIVSALLAKIKQGSSKYGPHTSMNKLDLKQLLALSLTAMVEDAKAKLLLLQGTTFLAAAAAAEKKALATDPPRVALSDTKVYENDEGMSLWYYTGCGNDWYPNKLCAEMAARAQFPDEDPNKRYARIFYKTFTRGD